ncbi:phosphatidic acid phosphatase type 2/haloperoxidase [Massariosphaeria phaeospora]|uniref:Phosphatidic acid phosphatase type 2/haloperoxidase n=1 Tax=Massariosphaeria phaeospora TaxID=100035 RepID=A0A7C8MWZ6_9PLEO|nr:phosphatidic acid phosphatase type 2/haloperoxidase [Massariosphaeria phaeospora]
MDDWRSNKLPERLPFSKKRLPKKVIISYVIDYVIIVGLIAMFYAIDKVDPFHQPFSLRNYTLRYPYAVHERIPVPELLLIVVGAPAVIIAIYTLGIDGLFSHQTPMPTTRGVKRLAGRYRFKDRLWELNCGILGLGLSVCAAFTITGALKNAIGKPRPDIIDRCNLKDANADLWALVTVADCKQDDQRILQDGFKSFPSGHSSTAFAGLFYLSLYLAAKLHVLDSKGEVWKSFIVLIPTLAACLVSGSRIMDARHHPFDVLSGAAMGILVAWGSYRQYFPPLSETWRKGRAFPIRAWGREPVAPQNPAVRVDEDSEPLRLMRAPTDEERGASSGFAAQPAVGGGAAHGGNVFREQISSSQRRRQDDPHHGFTHSGIPHSDTMGSTISTKVSRFQGEMPVNSPYTAEAPRRHDTYDYSSSEDEDNYELQQRYNLSTPQSGAAYNPVQGQFMDTGYHSSTGISPNPTPPPPANFSQPLQPTIRSPATGDITETRRDAGPAPPTHAAGTLPQQV